MIDPIKGFFKVYINDISRSPLEEDSRMNGFMEIKLVSVDSLLRKPCCYVVRIFWNKGISFELMILGKKLGII